MRRPRPGRRGSGGGSGRRGKLARARPAPACTRASCRRSGACRGRRRTPGRSPAPPRRSRAARAGARRHRRGRPPVPQPGQAREVGEECLAVGPLAMPVPELGDEVRLGRDRQLRVAIEHLLQQRRAASREAEDYDRCRRRAAHRSRDCQTTSAGGPAISTARSASCGSLGRPTSRQAAARASPARSIAPARAAHGARLAVRAGRDPQRRRAVGDIEGGVETQLALGRGVGGAGPARDRPGAGEHRVESGPGGDGAERVDDPTECLAAAYCHGMRE